jgi:hypothetical protein
MSSQKKKKQKEKACGKLENTPLHSDHPKDSGCFHSDHPKDSGCFPLSHRLDYYD